MACRTCDHTMQSVAPSVFWCPRCGTIKIGAEDRTADIQPPRSVGVVRGIVRVLRTGKPAAIPVTRAILQSLDDLNLRPTK